MRGVSNAARVLAVINDRWMTSAEVAAIIGNSERSARKTLQETRGIEGVETDEGWLYRRRQPQRAAS